MDLCLAFALFKLLRARFQNFQVEEEVAVKNRDLIFRGLSNNDDAGGQGVDDSTNGDDRDGDDSSSKQLAERAFQVIELELNFVMDYYHSVVPVVLCSPWFLVGNYFFVFLIVVNQAVIALVITGNGALLPVIGCLARDVVTLSRRAIVLFKCLGHKVLQTTIDLFSSFNILVSLLLFLTFLVMEAWEFVVYVLSDWLLVSLLCEYARAQVAVLTVGAESLLRVAVGETSRPAAQGHAVQPGVHPRHPPAHAVGDRLQAAAAPVPRDAVGARAEGG